MDAQRLPGFLLSRKVLDPARILREGLTVMDVSRRNLNFKVRYGKGDGLLVKQAGGYGTWYSPSSLKDEAAALQLIASEPEFEEVRPVVPRLVDHDADSAILAMELVHPGTSLTKLHLNGGRPWFPPEAAIAGRLLGRFHRAGREVAARRDDLRGRIPLGLGCFADTVAEREAFRGVFLPEAKASPSWEVGRQVLAGWNTHRDIIHGDMRLDNFLLTSGPGYHGGLNLRLIDWELSALGDGLWDFACMSADYIRFWMHCSNTRNAKSVADAERSATFPITTLEKPLALLWQEYAAGRAWTSEEEASEKKRLPDLVSSVLLAYSWEAIANLQRTKQVTEMPINSRWLIEMSTRVNASQHILGLAEVAA